MSFGTSSIVLGPGEGKTLQVLTNPHTVKAAGNDSGVPYSVTETIIMGPGPPRHIHQAEEEAFYVLEGEVNILLGDTTLKAAPGSFVLIPRGTVHTFSRAGTGPAKILTIFSPPGFESFYEEIDGLSDMNQIIAIAPKYGLEIVGPPL